MSDEAGFQKHEYDIKVLINRTKFQQGVLGLRQKWDIPADGFPDNRAMNAWSEHIAANNLATEVERDIRDFLVELALADRWYEGVRYFMLLNSPYLLRAISPYALSFEHEGTARERKNIQAVWIKVDAETTQEELLEAFADAQDLLAMKRKKKQYIENFDRDLEVLAKHRNGEKNSEIAEWLNENEPSKAVAFDANDVSKIIKRMKSRLES